MLPREELDRSIRRLQEYQGQRRDYIRAKNRVLLQAKAAVRRYLDWQPDQEDTKREATNKRAGKIVDTFFAGKPLAEDDAEIVGRMGGQLLVFRDMVEPALNAIKRTEKDMVSIAGTLPGAEFVRGVPGFGMKTLAIIVGEAGDIGAYPAKGHLRKRLGLAPFEKDGEVKAMSTWARQGGLSKEDWIAAGYAPSRRAEIHACLAEPMARGKQLESGEKSGTKYGRPKGKYGEVYVRRRERTEVTHPDWQPARARMDALRKMSKVAIHDLWLAWRRDIGNVPEWVKPNLPAADGHVDGQGVARAVPRKEVGGALPPAQLNAA